jgi:hypothetical protein
LGCLHKSRVPRRLAPQPSVRMRARPSGVCRNSSTSWTSRAQTRSLEQRRYCKCRNSNLRPFQFLRVNRFLQGASRDAYGRFAKGFGTACWFNPYRLGFQSAGNGARLNRSTAPNGSPKSIGSAIGAAQKKPLKTCREIRGNPTDTSGQRWTCHHICYHPIFFKLLVTKHLEARGVEPLFR